MQTWLGENIIPVRGTVVNDTELVSSWPTPTLSTVLVFTNWSTSTFSVSFITLITSTLQTTQTNMWTLSSGTMLESRHKGRNAPSVGSPVVDEIRPVVHCVSFNVLTLLVWWQEAHLAHKQFVTYFQRFFQKKWGKKTEQQPSPGSCVKQ